MRLRRPFPPRLLLLLLFPLVVVAGCENAEAPTTPAPPADPAVVDASGGSVSAANGSAGVTVPPGALASPVRITVTPQQSAAAANATVGSAYRFEPSGTQFSTPATVRLTFDENAFRPGTDLTRLRLARLEGGVWVPRGEGIEVDAAGREVRGRVSSFSTYGVWADPCLPRGIGVDETRSERLVSEDCLFESGSAQRRSQYFEFSVSGTTAVDFAWSGQFDFVTGIKEATESPQEGTVWGSLSGNEGNGRAGALRTILAPGSYQLFVSGQDVTQLGDYQIGLSTLPVSQATAGLGCAGYSLIVPGTTVDGAKLDLGEGDCQTTIKFTPFPEFLGRPLVLDNFIVRLLPGRRYTVNVNSGAARAPTLTVYAGGQVRAQRLEDGSPSFSLELTPPSLTYYQLELSATAPTVEQLPVVPYTLSVTEGSAPVPATVEITTGEVELTVPGDTVRVRASVRLGDGGAVPAAVVSWTSSDPAVARVAGSGVVTAVSAGSAILTASWGAGSASVPVTVDPTKLALVHDGEPVRAGSLTPLTLRVGSFGSATPTVRVDGAAAGATVENDRLEVWIPLGGTGPVEVDVEVVDQGVVRTGRRTLQRQAVPAPANPAAYLADYSSGLTADLERFRTTAQGQGSAGELRTRNVDRALAALTPGTDALAQLTDEQKARLATLLAAAEAGASGSAPVGSAPTGVDLPASCIDRSSIASRGEHRFCVEQVLAVNAARRATLGSAEAQCRDAVKLASIGSILDALESVALKAYACVRYYVLASSLEELPVDAPVLNRRLRPRYTSGGVRGVAGPGGEVPAAAWTQDDPLVARSGALAPLELGIEAANPSAADGAVPLAGDLLAEVGFFAQLWQELQALVDGDLEPEVPQLLGAGAVTLTTGAQVGEVRIVSVGRAGVTGELVDVGSDVALRLSGPSSGDESFIVTLETSDARAGTARVDLPVRLLAGYPELRSAGVVGWSDVNQNAQCNASFPRGTNGEARIRIELSEPAPEEGGFVTTVYWVGGSGPGYVPTSELQPVGDRTYEFTRGFCWGGPTGSLDFELQFEAVDGTRTNSLRFRVPRP